jgi:hypothetical protein
LEKYVDEALTEFVMSREAEELVEIGSAVQVYELCPEFSISYAYHGAARALP